jgi:RNA polymerase sigma-70 factor (ECF subfamily)
VAPGEQTDAELVRLAQTGDVEAFAEIGVNAALARTRRKQLPLTELGSLESERAVYVPREPAAPEQAAQASNLRSRIVTALAELPFEYREAVVLRDVAGLSNQEVAAALDISLPAAKSRIHRGRLQLRGLLEPLEQ